MQNILVVKTDITSLEFQKVFKILKIRFSLHFLIKMSEANQNQNDNNNNNNDSNNNDNKNDKNYDDLTEEQLEQEIQATQRRLQYLCARKWDRECKKEREMQQQKENQQQSEETQSQEFQQWQYFNPEHHRHHHHFGHFGPWQWKHQWDQECRGPCHKGPCHKGPCHKCHCHKGPCQKNTQCPNKHNEKVDHGEKPQSCHRPHERCFQCPPFFNPWWAYWQIGCHPCHEKSPEQMRDGHQERRQERWSPQDYWRYYYGYQGYESPQPPPQQQETAKDNNNNNNDNDNDNKKNEEQQIVEEEEEVAEVEQKDNSGYYGPDW